MASACKSMRILVTGCTGYLAQFIIQYLSSDPSIELYCTKRDSSVAPEGMSANIVGYETSMDYGEHSSVISYTKCKRIKTYVIKLSCEVINADTVLDINEDNIQWDSNKKAYKTILNLLDSHPEHDESMGKFKFDKKYSC